MTCVKDGFLHLRVLKLWMLGDLEQWTIEEDAMPLLRKLEIRRCNYLEEIYGLRYLRSLKDLTLTNMSETVIDKVKRSIGQDVHVKVNDWEFSHYQVGLHNNQHLRGISSFSLTYDLSVYSFSCRTQVHFGDSNGGSHESDFADDIEGSDAHTEEEEDSNADSEFGSVDNDDELPDEEGNYDDEDDEEDHGEDEDDYEIRQS